MYSLRTISKNETVNEALGNSYVRVDRHQSENFQQVYRDVFGKDHVADLDDTADEVSKKIVAFIMAGQVHPIFSDQWAYIVGPSGDTYECVNNPNKVGRRIA